MKDALMKYETIDAGQIDDLMERKTEIREPAGWGITLTSQRLKIQFKMNLNQNLNKKKCHLQ